MTIDEKITFAARRDGGVENLEVKGTMMVLATQPESARVALNLSKNSSKNITYQARAGTGRHAVFALGCGRYPPCQPVVHRTSTRVTNVQPYEKYQVHPNVDKKAFKDDIIQLKNTDKPFPLNSAVGVLKWRFASTEESDAPLQRKQPQQQSWQGLRRNTDSVAPSHQLAHVCLLVRVVVMHVLRLYVYVYSLVSLAMVA